MSRIVGRVLTVLISVLLVPFHSSAQNTSSPIIITVAGGGLSAVPATSTGIGSAGSVALDHIGNLFIADSVNNVVRKVDLNGNMTVVAGNGAPSYLLDVGFDPGCGTIGRVGDGGPAVNAELSYPVVLAVDGTANLYIADCYVLIRKVDPNGIITTVAGTGSSGFSGDGGPATNAQFQAFALAADNVGNIYMVDGGTRVRKINTLGIITTVAGNGTLGFSGDGGPAINAQLFNAFSIAVDNNGNIFILEGDARIRKVNANGIISTIAGTGTAGFSGDGGPAVSAQISANTYSVALDSSGNLYMTDGGSRVREINSAGVISTVAGTGTQGYTGDGGPAVSAEITAEVIAVDIFGNSFISDNNSSQGARIRKINSVGVISTFAGNGTLGFSGDNKLATKVEIDNPTGLAVDSLGNLYIGDWNNYRIRKVDTSGQITTIAGTGMPCFGMSTCSGDGGPATSAQLGAPYGITADGMGNLYFVDGTYGCSCVRKIDASGVIHTVAGGGTSVPGDGGPATSALLMPVAVALDSIGNLYISENNAYSPSSFRVRKVDTAGTITTIAGTGTAGFSGDGGPATAAQLSNPSGLAFDSAGNLYVGDGTRLRKIDTHGVISTFAGNGTSGFTGDGGPATNAELAIVDGVAVDRTGNIYITDGNNRVRKVDTQGIIATFAGTGTVGYSGDGGPAADAEFSHPGGLAIDKNGNVFVGDVFNYRVREIVVSPAPAVVLSPTSLTFGDQLATTASTAQTLTLSNGGTAALSVTSVGIIGTNAGDFSQTNNCGTSVAVSASCSINVTFTPSASGSRSGTLSIADNASGSPQTFSLVGTGTDFSITIASGGSTAATVTAGQSATYNLQLNALSGFTGSVTVSCTGAPTQATCTSSASAINVTGASSPLTITVSTTARSFAPPTTTNRREPQHWIVPLGVLLLVLALILTYAMDRVSRGARRRYAWVYAGLLLAWVVSLVVGCGGGGGGGGGNTGTPAGAYSLTITGTDQGVQRSLTLSLTVN